MGGNKGKSIKKKGKVKRKAKKKTKKKEPTVRTERLSFSAKPSALCPHCGNLIMLSKIEDNWTHTTVTWT